MASLLKRTLLSTSVLLGFATTANAAFNCSDNPTTDLDAHIIEATPLTLGPVNPKNGGALWLMDSNGVRLEVCLDGNGNQECFYDQVDDDNPYSQRVGFGPEAFWWLAEAAIDVDEQENRRGNIIHPGFSALIVMAAEFAWISEDPAPGEQFPFTRLRFRLQVPELGTYYVTHPYGREVFVVDDSFLDDGDIDRIFVSFDIELPTEGLGQGRIGPFLTVDVADPDSPVPAGHIGSLGGEQTVTGSPCDTNYFEVRGVALDGFTPIDLDGEGSSVLSTDKFAVMGKLATRSGVNVTRATYTRGDWDPGMEVFANTFADPDPLVVSALTVSADLSDGTDGTYPLVAGSVNPSGNSRSYTLLQEAYDGIDYPPQDVIVTNVSDGISNGPEDLIACIPDNSCESSVVVPLVDMVNISEAYYNKQEDVVEIAAWTTDDRSSCAPGDPKLTAYADDGTYLGVLDVPVDPLVRHLGVELHFTLDDPLTAEIEGPVETVPPRIIVKSCWGGASDTSSLDIGLCDQAGQSQNCSGGN
jgi:hypothetical protein